MQDDDLLQKADALMHRRRVFVAGASVQEEAFVANAADDIPMLTEVVDPVLLTAPAIEPPPTIDVAELRNAMAVELEAWLDEQLPQHVMRVLDGITDQLIIQLSLKSRAELLPKLQQILESSLPAAKPDSADD
jgi:hypothetical protein